MFRRYLNSCVQFVQSRVPQSCLLCGTGVRGALLCAGCAGDLPQLPEMRCPQCALPTPDGGLCGNCLKRPPHFDRTRAAFRYGFPLDALVQAYKYRHRLELADLFAHALAGELVGKVLPVNAFAGPPLKRVGPNGGAVDLILCMPLHPDRLAERGYNQATEIARRLARHLQQPWAAEACRRIRATPPQAGLGLKARRSNLRGAFVCDADLSGMRVALVDDVMTSGSSLNELARVVKKAGAVEVEAWVVARTL